MSATDIIQRTSRLLGISAKPARGRKKRDWLIPSVRSPTRPPEPPGSLCPPCPSINEIVLAASEVTGVPVRQIMSPRRDRKIARARHICMYLARDMTARSYPEIGERLHGRDHTTVMYGIRVVEKAMEQDRDMVDDVEAVRSRVFLRMGLAPNG